MDKYFWINAERIKKSRHQEQTGGMEITVELSPYEMPTSVVGGYIKKTGENTGEFVITFQYIDQEEAAVNPNDYQGVKVREGKNSGKILSISIPIDNPPHDNIGIISLRAKVMAALRSRKEQLKRTKKTLNQDVAEEILADEEGALEALTS